MNKTIDYILEVAKCGGITKAANNLYITPSALSKYVQMKENELQVKLFIRDGKKFTLTYAGERYVEMLQQMLEYQRKMDNEMKRIASMYMGRLRIGFQMSLAETVISKIVPEFQKKYPNIQILLEETSSNELYQMLASNQLDMVISLTDKMDENLNYISIAESRWVLAVPLDSPLIKDAVNKEGFIYPWIDLKKYKEQKAIFFSQGQHMRQIGEQIFDSYGIKSDVRVLVKTTRTALLCVKSNMGVAICSELLVKHHHMENSIVMLEFGEDEKKETMAISYSKKSMLTEEIVQLAEICQKYI